MYPLLCSVWSHVYYLLLRPIWKWILHLLTGKCELLRITCEQTCGMARTSAIEYSLKHSKQPQLKHLLTDDPINVDTEVQNIAKIKCVNTDVHPEFCSSLQTCLCQICGYAELKKEADTIRKIPYSSENPVHEKLLMELWETLRPGVSLESRISRQWSEIGFQGDDPMTDFRGMGLLGLQNLVYFVRNHTGAAHQMVSQSAHPQLGYSFAIVGINITGMTFHILLKDHLKTHFYNTVQGRPSIEDFHKVYCYLLYEFGRFWIAEKPRDIMEFNRVKSKFQNIIIDQLSDPSTSLKFNLTNQ